MADILDVKSKLPHGVAATQTVVPRGLALAGIAATLRFDKRTNPRPVIAFGDPEVELFTRGCVTVSQTQGPWLDEADIACLFLLLKKVVDAEVDGEYIHVALHEALFAEELYGSRGGAQRQALHDSLKMLRSAQFKLITTGLVPVEGQLIVRSIEAPKTDERRGQWRVVTLDYQFTKWMFDLGWSLFNIKNHLAMRKSPLAQAFHRLFTCDERQAVVTISLGELRTFARRNNQADRRWLADARKAMDVLCEQLGFTYTCDFRLTSQLTLDRGAKIRARVEGRAERRAELVKRGKERAASARVAVASTASTAKGPAQGRSKAPVDDGMTIDCPPPRELPNQSQLGDLGTTAPIAPPQAPKAPPPAENVYAWLDKLSDEDMHTVLVHFLGRDAAGGSRSDKKINLYGLVRQGVTIQAMQHIFSDLYVMIEHRYGEDCAGYILDHNSIDPHAKGTRYGQRVAALHNLVVAGLPRAEVLRLVEAYNAHCAATQGPDAI